VLPKHIAQAKDEYVKADDARFTARLAAMAAQEQKNKAASAPALPGEGAGAGRAQDTTVADKVAAAPRGQKVEALKVAALDAYRKDKAAGRA
jgi:hypothetical protein